MDGLECSTLDNHSDEVLCCCRLSVNGNSSWFEVVDSGHWQMLPSSPNLQDTSLGSTHIVNSLGRQRDMLERPVTLAASLRTGSIFPFILMQRQALPFLGFSGCQWSLYLFSNTSPSLSENGLMNWTGRFLLSIILAKNSHAQANSVFMVLFRQQLLPFGRYQLGEPLLSTEQDRRPGISNYKLLFTVHSFFLLLTPFITLHNNDVSRRGLGN